MPKLKKEEEEWGLGVERGGAPAEAGATPGTTNHHHHLHKEQQPLVKILAIAEITQVITPK